LQPVAISSNSKRDNYYAPGRKYLAIRVMEIDSNNRLKQRVLAGELDQYVGAACSSRTA